MVRISILAYHLYCKKDEFGNQVDVPPTTEQERCEVLGVVKAFGKSLLDKFVKPESDKKIYDDPYLQMLADENEYPNMEANNRNSIEIFNRKNHIEYIVYCPLNPLANDNNTAYYQAKHYEKFLNRIFPNWGFSISSVFSYNGFWDWCSDYAECVENLMNENQNMSVKKAEEICTEKFNSDSFDKYFDSLIEQKESKI